jgi:hypothetical protein
VRSGDSVLVGDEVVALQDPFPARSIGRVPSLTPRHLPSGPWPIPSSRSGTR